MVKRHRVQVTAVDIMYGKRHEPYACPIALAIKRQIPEAQNVAVRRNVVRWGEGCWATMSRAGQRFVRRYDDGREVKPITIVLTEEA